MSSSKPVVIDPDLYGDIKDIVRKLNCDYIGFLHQKIEIPDSKMRIHKKAFDIYERLLRVNTGSGKKKLCPDCHGSKMMNGTACRMCLGTGRVTKWLKVPVAQRRYLFNGRKIVIIKTGHTQSVLYSFEGETAVRKMTKAEFKLGVTDRLDLNTKPGV